MTCDRFHLLCDCVVDENNSVSLQLPSLQQANSNEAASSDCESLQFHLTSDCQVDDHIFQKRSEEMDITVPVVGRSKGVLRSGTKSIASTRKQVLPRKTVRRTKGSSMKAKCRTNPRSTKRNRLQRSHVNDETGKMEAEGERVFFSQMAFARLVREVTVDINPKTTFKFQKTAFEALQMGCEAFLAKLFENINLVATHCERSTIFQRDIKLLKEIAIKFLGAANNNVNETWYSHNGRKDERQEI